MIAGVAARMLGRVGMRWRRTPVVRLVTEMLVLSPGPAHPITVEPHPARVVVRRGEQVLADTTSALVLREASYPPVFYIPRDDAALDLLAPTAHETYCPYKGDASYFTIVAGGAPAENAVWSYAEPHHALAEIRGRLAFYPDRVEFEQHPAA